MFANLIYGSRTWYFIPICIERGTLIGSIVPSGDQGEREKKNPFAQIMLMDMLCTLICLSIYHCDLGKILLL